MREININELEGSWRIGRLVDCLYDENINLYFKDNNITINGINDLDIFNVKYEIRDNGNAKFLYLEEIDMFIEVWMIMDNDSNSIIIKMNDIKYYFEKNI